MDAAPRLVDVNDKFSARGGTAPLTSDLLARKGEAVSAAREVLNAHAAAPQSFAEMAGDMPRNPEAQPQSGAVLSKKWVAVAAVLLIGGSVAVGYLSRPALENSAVVRSEPVAKSVPAPKALTLAPIPGIPKRDEIATDIAVASGPKAPVSVVPAPAEEAKPIATAVNTVPAVPAPPKLLLPPKPPAATSVAANAAIEKAVAPVKIPAFKPVAAVSPSVPKPTAKPVANPSPRPKKTEIAARPPPATIATPAVKRPFVVQLASLKSKPTALREWGRLKKRYATLFSGLEPSVQKASIREARHLLPPAGRRFRNTPPSECGLPENEGRGAGMPRRKTLSARESAP